MRLSRVLAAGFAVALSAAPAAAQTRWNLPAAYPTDNPHTVNLMDFAKDVSDATGGKLQVTVHAAASLFKAPEIKRAVQTGQAQMGEVLLSIHENEDPLYGIDIVPFLATSYGQSRKLWKVTRPAIEKRLAAQGMMVLMGVPWGPQGIYAKKDINALEDMRGLKWRSYNVGTAKIGELVGAQSVTVQAAELPQALATGVVNSQRPRTPPLAAVSASAKAAASSERKRVASARIALHTIDERPSGSGRKASGPVARNRCHAVLPCGFVVRTWATSAS